MATDADGHPVRETYEAAVRWSLYGALNAVLLGRSKAYEAALDLLRDAACNLGVIRFKLRRLTLAELNDKWGHHNVLRVLDTVIETTGERV